MSALKSREIEEWRPKPGGGGQDRVQRLRQLGKCNDSRKKRRAEKTERGRREEVVREGWPDRRVKAYAEEKIGKK